MNATRTAWGFVLSAQIAAASATGAAPAVPRCGTEPDATHVRAPGSLALFDDACPTYGPCDDPAVRDTTGMSWLNLRTVVHMFRMGNGSGGVSMATVNATLDQMNHDLRANGTGIQLDAAVIRQHDDDGWYCMPPCEGLHQCRDSFSFLRSLKSTFAEDPEHQLNIYVSCHPTTANGSLAGISYYPWSSSPLGTPGGFWINVDGGVGGGNFVATHELGHSLGLYHTFRGVSEIDSCGSPCMENVLGVDNDLRGDLAADTPPTPVHDVCGGPGSNDCEGTPFGATQPENFMGYGPPGCQHLFTSTQKRRMQCWARQALRSWLTSPPATCERLADTGTRGLWHLGEGAGVTTAEAQGGATMQLSGDVAWSMSGCGSTAVAFDGPGEGLHIDGAITAAMPAGTIECSFQWSGAVPGMAHAWIFDQSSGPEASNLGLALAADSTLRLHIALAERVVSVTRIRPLRWYRVAARWDGAMAAIDLDDLRDAESATTAVPATLGAPLWFGRSGGTVAGGEFDGALDEVRVSDVARVLPVAFLAPPPTLRVTVSPNPASGRLSVHFDLPAPDRVRVELFDLFGRRVATLADRDFTAGSHDVRWSGSSAPGGRVRAGVLMARVTSGGGAATRAVVFRP